MPDIYRAPEVILGMKWHNKIDIWNVGVMVSNTFLSFTGAFGHDTPGALVNPACSQIWDLFESNHMFDGRNIKRIISDKYHLSEMIAILGPPPLEFLTRSKNSFNYFDEEGL